MIKKILAILVLLCVIGKPSLAASTQTLSLVKETYDGTSIVREYHTEKGNVIMDYTQVPLDIVKHVSAMKGVNSLVEVKKEMEAAFLCLGLKEKLADLNNEHLYRYPTVMPTVDIQLKRTFDEQTQIAVLYAKEQKAIYDKLSPEEKNKMYNPKVQGYEPIPTVGGKVEKKVTPLDIGAETTKQKSHPWVFIGMGVFVIGIFVLTMKAIKKGR